MKLFFSIISTALVLGCLSQSSCGNDYFGFIDTTQVSVADNIRKTNIGRPYFNRQIKRKTRSFYEGNGYRVHWLREKNPHQRFDALIDEIQASEAYGLNAADYRLRELQEDVENFYGLKSHDPSRIAALDMKITSTFFLFTTHLLEGRIVKAGSGRFIWKKGMAPEKDVALLLKNSTPSSLRAALGELRPVDPQYELLGRELERLKGLSSVSLPKIQWTKNIRPGHSDKAIPDVRKRLSLLYDDAIPAHGDPLLYDNALRQVVADFQETRGLEPNGTIDKETAHSLNVPFSQLGETVAINLERLRWQPHMDAKEDYILINIPEYRLRVFHGKRKMLDMKVILGADATSTPIFHDTLKYIVFSPTWTVPRSIIAKEFLPRLKEDPAYYKKQGFVFYKEGVEIDPEDEKWSDRDIDLRSYRVVQAPGDINALGNIKFVMPNNFSIYLHDTPADRLFSKDIRALSHGCVRLEQPVQLARYLLQDQKEWNEDAIRSAMQSDKPVTVHLSMPMPVHIVYRTAWVDERNRVNFRDDIYGYDQRHLAELGDHHGLSLSK